MSDFFGIYADYRPLIVIGGILLLFLVLYVIIYFQNRKPGKMSIKEGFDYLPTAVVYFLPNGMPKICNHQMYRLYRILGGSMVLSLENFKRILQEADKREDIRKLPGDDYCLPDNTVWHYMEKEVITDDGRIYTKLQFSEVTRIYRKRKELEEQKKKLEKLSYELKKRYANVRKISREKEIFSAKSRLHDEMGAALTALRQALGHENAEERDRAVKILGKSIAGIAGREDNLADKNKLEELKHDAAMLHTVLKINGQLPDNKEISEVFLLAMRECLSNAVRHADADEIKAEIRCERGEACLDITNNGRPPENGIIPRGGLLNLQWYVSTLGGGMKIISRPAFKLRLCVPLGKETEKQVGSE